MFLNHRTGEVRHGIPGGEAPGRAKSAVVGGLKSAIADPISRWLDRIPGGPEVKRVGGKVRAGIHAVEHGLFSAMIHSGQLAEEAAHERGLSDGHVQCLGRIFRASDFIPSK